MENSKIAIIVHGGAKDMEPEEYEPHREGCRRAAEVGWEVLQRGGTAVDAVEAAIRVMEDDPTFNAGYGAELNADGEVQMDASLIDGGSLNAGSVGFIQGVRHPISVARKVLESGTVFLVGDGANRFAQEQGAELCDNRELETEERRKKWEKTIAEGNGGTGANNTVGCVALDQNGDLAAGASTGGTGCNPRGRIGDTPQLGCGFYADNQRGGCSMTGDGESIARVVLAKTTVDQLGEVPPDEAAARSMQILGDRTEGDGGCIVIDRQSRIGWDHNSGNMAVAYRTPDLPEARAYVHKREESED
jgi:beta-aspartyl-peptidase (threonine type)